MKKLALAVVFVVSAVGWARAEQTPSALEILERSQRAFYYPGADMAARVTMELVTESGKRRTRVLTMLRKNDPNGRDQKYFLYFHEPGDVRRTAFLVWKYAERDDDRWIFLPAVNLVRRVAASDSRSSFVGSDFTYEDLSGRDLSADAHARVREEKVGERECWVVESAPKSAAEYTRKLAWVDKAAFLPLREEYYDAQDELVRVFTADAIENVAARATGDVHPTITRRAMRNVKSGHRTEATFTGVAYDVGLDDGVFTERSLQSPPQQWIR